MKRVEREIYEFMDAEYAACPSDEARVEELRARVRANAERKASRPRLKKLLTAAACICIAVVSGFMGAMLTPKTPLFSSAGNYYKEQLSANEFWKWVPEESSFLKELVEDVQRDEDYRFTSVSLLRHKETDLPIGLEYCFGMYSQFLTDFFFGTETNDSFTFYVPLVPDFKVYAHDQFEVNAREIEVNGVSILVNQMVNKTDYEVYYTFMLENTRYYVQYESMNLEGYVHDYSFCERFVEAALGVPSIDWPEIGKDLPETGNSL